MFLPVVVATLLIVFMIIGFGSTNNLPSGWYNTTLLTASAAVVAALITLGANFFTNRTKVSEFRQEWINELREDIANYLSKCSQWIDLWVDHNQPDTSQEERSKNYAKAKKLGGEAKVLLYKIKLRINPRDDNPTKQEDEQFLAQLENILSPMSAKPPQPLESHTQEVEKALMLARQLLKREWETTKGFIKW